MRTLSWKEIAEQIKTDSEINFLGRAMTPLHVLGVETFLLSLIERGIKCKGYILAVAHCQTGLALGENSFHSSLYEGVEPVFLDEDEEPKSRISTLLNAGKKDNKRNAFYLANPYRVELGYVSELLALRPHDKIEITVTEEGNASYGSNPYRLTYAMILGLGIKNSIRFFFESSIKDRYLTKYIGKNMAIRHFLMLNRNSGTWEQNDTYARNVIKILSASERKEEWLNYENAIVFCPSPLFEGGFLKYRQDVEIYKKIKDILGCSEKFIVRPHPREKDKGVYAVLDCTIDEGWGRSLEEVLAGLDRKPKYIIGDSSSVLVNVRALFGIKTISINKLLDKNVLSDKHFFDSFNNLFVGVCYIPASFKELLDFLGKKEL